MKENIYLFDTTLRDGSQTQGVDFSIDDKNKITLALSNLGLDYIEGGWPGANPLDTSFFNTPPKMNHRLWRNHCRLGLQFKVCLSREFKICGANCFL